jgi:hypothetical protein
MRSGHQAVFDGSSGDSGPEYIVALRKALERIKAIDGSSPGE